MNPKRSGIVMKSAQRTFYCRLENGEMVEAVALGNLLKSEHNLVVGDVVEILEQDNHWEIVAVAPRRSEIFRFLPRENKRKITAANVDVMAVVVSGEKPEYKRGMVDRFLLRAIQWDITPILIFNKMDLFKNGFDIVFEAERLNALGVTSFEISALDLNYRPMHLGKGAYELQQTLAKKTTIFLGQSGVGKSHCINFLSQGRFDLKTQILGKAGKGMHTTTWSEIIDCGDFLLVDSPGIRSFSIVDFLDRDIEAYFPDLYPHFSRCQFTNCQHSGDTKGCGFSSLSIDIKAEAMVLTRLESYLRLKQEISATPDWEKLK